MPVVTDGTTEYNAAAMNKLVSALGDTLNVAIAVGRILGTITTPTCTNITGFSTTVTDGGTGVYSVTYTTPFGSTPAVIPSASRADGAFAVANLSTESSAGCTIKVWDANGDAVDAVVFIIAVSSRA